MEIKTEVYPIQVILEQDMGGQLTKYVGKFNTVSTALPQLQQVANSDLFLSVMYRRLGSRRGWSTLTPE